MAWNMSPSACLTDRLNVLGNVIRKPIEAILNEFSGAEDGDSSAGDVKYHLGANYVRPTP
jgi:2-oxoglutarate dehydrogenase E1 component